MWEDILLSASLGKHQIKFPDPSDPSTNGKAQGDHEEGTAEQVVPPPEIDFSLEGLKSDIKVFLAFPGGNPLVHCTLYPTYPCMSFLLAYYCCPDISCEVWIRFLGVEVGRLL